MPEHPSVITVLGPDCLDTTPGQTNGELFIWMDFKASLPRLLFRARASQPVCFHCQDFSHLPKPGILLPLLWLVGRSKATIRNERGETRTITMTDCVRAMVNMIAEKPARRRLYRNLYRAFANRSHQANGQNIDLDQPCHLHFVRGDINFAIGGAESHTRGVLQGFASKGHKTSLYCCYQPKALPDSTNMVKHSIPETFSNDPETRQVAYNFDMAETIIRHINDNKDTTLIYQRHGAFSFAGLLATQQTGAPFILEYNGSEVWINDNWGQALKHRDAALDIEKAVLEAADLVVTISEVLYDDLRERGVPASKIVVTPNGVDTDSFRPDICAPHAAQEIQGTKSLRQKAKDKQDKDNKHGLRFGFIGTFGTWHGTHLIPAIFEKWCQLADQAALPPSELVLYGDGDGRIPCQTDAATRSFGEHQLTFHGRIEAELVPAALAGCDILISPHVANSDGTAFFGSPTKLFEYMACGRAIVASDLGQIGDILDDQQSALLIPPGDVHAFATAMLTLALDPELRTTLGQEARRQAVDKHSWAIHVGKILNSLDKTSRDSRAPMEAEQ